MYKLNKEDINSLKNVEEFFKEIREGYKRASSIKDDMVVADIYTKLTGKVEKNFACGQCSFRMYKVVGDAYFDALKTLDTVADTDKKTKPTTKTVKKNGQRRTKAKKE